MTDTGAPIPQASRAIWRAFLSAGLGLVVVAVVAWLVARAMDEDLGAVLARAHPGWLVVAWIAMTNAYVTVSGRWRALMPPEHRPSLGGLTAIQCSGLLLNYAVPGPVGELGAAWLAQRRYGVPLPDGLATALTGRVIGLVSAAVLALVVWAAFDLPISQDLQAPVGAVAVVMGVGGAAGVWVALRPALAGRLVHAVLGRVTGPGLLGRAAAAMDRIATSLVDALGAVARRGWLAWTTAIAWSLFAHASVALGIGLAAWSLGAEPSAPGVLFTYTAVTAATVLLYAAPGSQVAWDAMLAGLLVASAGLDVADALAVAVIVRVQQISVMAVGAGALVWLLRGSDTETL